jgi:hypothetical protein
MKFRASSLGKLMTSARSKSEVLSQTAKSYIEQIAKENFFNYHSQISSRYIDKGQQQEQDSIELLNTVRMESYTKHIGRVSNDYLTGECDIITSDTIIDIKTSWSIDTWPELSEKGYNSDYEWQMRAYMMLYDRPQAEVIYCLVTTDPDLLSSFDNHELHQVDHIPADKRITVLQYDRDILVEAEIMERLAICSEYYENYYKQLTLK